MSAAVLDDYCAWIECLIGWIDDQVLVVGDIFGLLWRGAHFVVDWNRWDWYWYWMFGEILSLLFHTLLYTFDGMIFFLLFCISCVIYYNDFVL